MGAGGAPQAQGKLVWRGMGREVQVFGFQPTPPLAHRWSSQDGPAGVLISDGVMGWGPGLEFSWIPQAASLIQSMVPLLTQHSPSLESMLHPYLAANDGRKCHAWKGTEA